MTVRNARFPVQRRAARKPPLVVNDPELHRSQHEHLWRSFGDLRQCLLCLATEVDGE